MRSLFLGTFGAFGTLLVSLTAACGPEAGQTPLDPPDIAGYQTNVHPIVEARCGTLDCHGDLDRPLRIYAETGLRLRDDLRDQPITAEEIDASARSLLAVDPGVVDPMDRLVLTKPLAGFVFHEGGAIWLDPSEPQPTCVAGWLASRLDDPAVADACAQALLEVALPEP
jgi:hypothetical protein